MSRFSASLPQISLAFFRLFTHARTHAYTHGRVFSRGFSRRYGIRSVEREGSRGFPAIREFETRIVWIYASIHERTAVTNTITLKFVTSRTSQHTTIRLYYSRPPSFLESHLRFFGYLYSVYFVILKFIFVPVCNARKQLLTKEHFN